MWIPKAPYGPVKISSVKKNLGSKYYNGSFMISNWGASHKGERNEK